MRLALEKSGLLSQFQESSRLVRSAPAKLTPGTRCVLSACPVESRKLLKLAPERFAASPNDSPAARAYEKLALRRLAPVNDVLPPRSA